MTGIDRPIRVALPRGELREALAERLAAVGFVAEGYGEGSRTYRFPVTGRPGIVVRVFSEQDIPIQVALGNYDLAITRLAWVDELLVRHQRDSIVPLRMLDLGWQSLVLAGAHGTDWMRLATEQPIEVATEYPDLATHVLNRLRVPRYRVFDVWGQAHAWPPDDADLALVAIEEPNNLFDTGPGMLEGEGLAPLLTVYTGPACLIANRQALAHRHLASALEALLALPAATRPGGFTLPVPDATIRLPRSRQMPPREQFRMAVPDGHAQRHTVAALADAGLSFAGYEMAQADRRPDSGLADVEVKVMRPQDMPRAVALGHFDLAVSGRDWLFAHTAAFPASPVIELGDLRRSRYSLGAVVTEDLPAATIVEAIAYWRRDDPRRTLRVASEYVALADHYARERHLGRYQVIPISGASEGFVPEDAEILIEGTETGTTLRANRLRMIDVIMESTNCLIGHTVRPEGRRGELRDELTARLAGAALAAQEG